jgi:rhodanese-related sulfurtransferase
MLKIKFKKNRKSRSTLYLIVISLLLIQFYNFASSGIAADPEITDIPIQLANGMINNNTGYPDLLVLDVRTDGEYNTNHLHNATSIPLAELAGRLTELASYNDTEIIVYCNSGVRSEEASNILINNNYYNFTKVYNMLGGISAWIAEGYDYWLNEDLMIIDFALPVFLVSLIGIIFVLVLFSKRRWKLVKTNYY